MRAAVVGGVLSVWVVGAVGCGPGTSSPTAETPATASAFCQKIEATNVQQVMTCYGGTAIDWSMTPFYGNSTCPALDDDVTSHRLTYDATKAAACLAEIAKPLPCSADAPSGPSCVRSVLVGGVADGEPCDSTYICRDGSICSPAGDGTDSCPAMLCQHVSVAGEKCDVNSGSFCNNAGCDGTTCQPFVQLGGACGDVGQSCDQNLYCAVGDPKPTCERDVENGPCANGVGCFDYQYCDSTTGRCRFRIVRGDDCSADPTGCESFTACDPTTHRCVEASHVGQLCGNIIGYQLVCEGGFCVYDADQVGHCVVPAANGDACAHDFECTSGFCASGKCADPPPNDGAPCTDGTTCTSRICAAGVCAARAPDGATCLLASDCQSGACLAGTCAPPAADGATCAEGSDCVSGHCAGGKCAPCM